MRQRRKSGLANGRLPANFGARSAARVRRQVERAELPRRPSYFLTEGYLIDATSGMDDAKEGEEELEEALPATSAAQTLALTLLQSCTSLFKMNGTMHLMIAR